MSRFPILLLYLWRWVDIDLLVLETKEIWKREFYLIHVVLPTLKTGEDVILFDLSFINPLGNIYDVGELHYQMFGILLPCWDGMHIVNDMLLSSYRQFIIENAPHCIFFIYEFRIHHYYFIDHSYWFLIMIFGILLHKDIVVW